MQPAACKLTITQIKEKYAGLRFYYSAEGSVAFRKKISKIVEHYEEISEHVCQRCGKYGRIRGKGWLEVMCNACYGKSKSELNYKQEFINFMIESQALKFGEFIQKSGRISPYFMNAGSYVTGSQLKRLGEYYARAIKENFGLDFDVLFGPAYKGIPLAVATTIAISELYGKEIRYCANRKEVKERGDTGILLGSKLSDGDRVVIIEDVTASGKSIAETYPILKAQADITVIGLMVSLNRMERGQGEQSAIAEIKEKYGIEARAIVTMAEVTEHLYNQPIAGTIYIDEAIKLELDKYYQQYGAGE